MPSTDEPQHYATFVSLHLNGARGACSSCRDRPEGAREDWVVGAHLKWDYARALYPPTSQTHTLVPSRRSRSRSPERWRLEDLPIAFPAELARFDRACHQFDVENKDYPVETAKDWATVFVQYPQTVKPPDGIFQRWQKIMDQAIQYARTYNQETHGIRATAHGTFQDWENLRQLAENQFSAWGMPVFPGGRPAAGLQMAAPAHPPGDRGAGLGAAQDQGLLLG